MSTQYNPSTTNTRVDVYFLYWAVWYISYQLNGRGVMIGVSLPAERGDVVFVLSH